MKHRRHITRRNDLLADTRGLSTVEYVIILSVVVVVGFAAWRRFGRTVEGQARRAEMVVARLGMETLP